MTREEIVAQQEQLAEQAMELLHKIGSWNKKERKVYWDIVKQDTNLQKELDKLDGKTYDSKKWITSFTAESRKSLKDARLQLIEKIKGLHGVEIEETNSGVSSVTVYTEHKIYHYTIHAHYYTEKIPESKRIVKGMFGEEMEEYDYRNVYVAEVNTNGSHWTWRY